MWFYEINFKIERENMQEQLKKGFDGSTLKYIAIITMLIDHIGAILVAPMVYEASLVEMNRTILFYQILRSIGRIAFPIFCFFLVEGFYYTRNVKKYAKRLFLFALLSEIPFDLGFRGTLWSMEGQNVFFTLFIGLCVMILLKKAEEKPMNQMQLIIVRLVIVAVGCIVALFLQTDYDMRGIISIAVLYLYRSKENRLMQLIAGAITFLWEPFALFAFVLLYFYNGERGRQPKYFFYGFYPIHILILYGIGLII